MLVGYIGSYTVVLALSDLSNIAENNYFTPTHISNNFTSPPIDHKVTSVTYNKLDLDLVVVSALSERASLYYYYTHRNWGACVHAAIGQQL